MGVDVSKLLKSFAVLLAVVGLVGCSNDSSSNEKVKGLDGPQTCIPESQLLNQGIVGGSRINPEDSDSKIVMMLNIPKGKELGICTAAAIAPDVLLTAGHCIDGDLSNAFVTLHTGLSCESGFDIRSSVTGVSSFVVHEKFDLNLSEDHADQTIGDIALVFLNESLPSNYPIYKIADPLKLNLSDRIYLYGYGTIGYDKSGAGLLRKTDLSLSKITLDRNEKKVFIDQSSGAGLCTGDSGGPGLVQIEGELQILGINSYVSGATGSDICQGIAGLVLADSYRDWIENKMLARGRSLRK